MTSFDSEAELLERRKSMANAFGQPLDPLASFELKFEQAGIDPWEPFQLFLDEVLRADDPRPRTFNQYVRLFRRWSEHMDRIGRHPACPNEQHVLEFIKYERINNGNSPSTVKGKLRSLSRVFDYWVSDPAFPHTQGFNPFTIARKKAKFNFQPKKKPHPIDLTTIRSLVQSVTHLRDRLLLLVGFKLGARVSEIRNMQLQDVVIDEIELTEHYESLGSHSRLAGLTDAIYIPSRHERPGNKSMRPRILPLDDELRDLLTRWLYVRPDIGERWLFLSKQRHDQLEKKPINKIWKDTFHPEFAETQNYRGVTSHFGRHYFCTYWRVEQDLNRELLKYLRGDALDEEIKAAETIDSYLHTYYRDIEDVYRRQIFRLSDSG